MIYFTSDFHFNHNKKFLYKPRGFDNIEDMNNTIINNFNEIITNEDDLYILGDLVLTDIDKEIEYIKRLNGKLHIILGNHDTSNKIEKYRKLDNVVEITYAAMLTYQKFKLFLTHYPSITCSNDKTRRLRDVVINLYGHTHQDTNFYNDNPYMYYVGVDSHNLRPVSIDEVLEECKTLNGKQ